jgi:DNA replication and repair protein RecF
MRALAVDWLKVRGFRNIKEADVELGPGLNVFRGDNGHGKTNLLEALYVVATTRSFRTPRLQEAIEFGGEVASVRAQVREDADVREQSVGLRGGRRVASVDGKRVSSLALYATTTPVVAFHPGVVTLSSGSSGERRKLLDRIALYRSPGSLANVADYARAARARQRVLEAGGETARGLDEWEEVMVRRGLAVREARSEAAGEIGGAAAAAHARIGPMELRLRADYEPGAPGEAEAFRAALVAGRRRDRARGSAGVGPHRDDLVLRFGETPIRGMASQGQHRAVVLALALAEMAVVGRGREVHPVLLLDDVSSELDRERMAALLAELMRHEGQVLLTTTRPELIEARGVRGLELRRDFVVVRGEIRAA